jgi:WD40 repeat protein
VTIEIVPTSSPPVEDPYVGLTYFTEEYVDFFFGRDNETALIIGNLRASRLTLLYAESGVGKSSVLRAGVVARLHDFAERDRQGGGHPRLVPVVFSSWSGRPVAGLVHAIGEAIHPYLAEAEAPELPDDLEAALEAASQALDATLLVILDQFEEHFLYPEEAPEEDRVAAQIARCVNRHDLRANFLISIREDSYAELGDLFRGKVKNVYGNFLHLDFLDRAGGREAIEKPIARLNELRPEAEPCEVEPALVDAVLDQVRRDEADERIETTFLQLVMRRLWEEETAAGSNVLRLQTLERLGGAQAIIGSHLDRAMEAGADGRAGLTAEQRLTAARVFRFLVTSGGTKIALTAGDLAELSGLSLAAVEPVLRHLSSPQLHILRPVVVQDEAGEPRFEIFHDALSEPIRKWRIRVEEEERSARRERERAEKEEAQRAAAEAERKAEEERRRKRLAQALLALAVIVLVVGAAVFAIIQKNIADQRDADNQSVRASERISELAGAPSFGPTPAALASIEAYGLSPTTEARERALAQLQLNPGLPEIIAGHTSGVESVTFWPGSDELVSGGDKTVRLWSERGIEEGEPLVAGGTVAAVAVSRAMEVGTHLIAAGLQGGGVKLWRAQQGGEPEDPPLLLPESGKMREVAFSPDNPDLLAVGGKGGEVALWNLRDPGKPERIGVASVPGSVEDLAFAPGRQRLYVASTKAGVMLELSRAGFKGSAPITEVDGEEAAAAAAPDGSYAFGGKGGIELQAAGRRRVHLSLPGKVESLAFAQKGSVLVSGGTDWNVTTWDVATGRPFGPPRSANRARVNDVAVSSDGAIAAAGDDRLIKVWSPGQRWHLGVTIGALSPEESGGNLPTIFDIAGGGKYKMAAAAGPAGTLIWPLTEWGGTHRVQAPVVIPGRSFAAASHKYILVTGQGDSFAVYRMNRSCDGGQEYCKLVTPPDPHSDEPVRNLVFGYVKDEKRLLLASSGSVGGKGIVNLWDLTDVRRSGGIKHLKPLILERPISGLALGRERPIVAAATTTGELTFWDVSDPDKPKEIAHKNPEKQALYALAFSGDGSLLAAGGQGQQVTLWRINEDTTEKEPVRELPGTLLQRQRINSLVFSPGGETLVAADAEGNVCLYRVDNRHLIGDSSCLRGYNIGALKHGGFEAVKFGYMPNHSVALFTAGRGQPLLAWNSLLWNLNDSSSVDKAIKESLCDLAHRNMKEYEWGAVFTSTDLAGPRKKTCPEYGLPPEREP